jgi:ubiquinol-cytochrome c reductase cytochrome c1 subunit
MVRLGAFLVGLFMAGWLLVSAGFTTYEMITEPAKPTVEHEFHLLPKKVSFAHDGLLGKFNNQQLQRGFKVYKEVCSACHSMNLVAFRNFQDIGYSEEQIKALAKDWPTPVPSVNPDTGEVSTRPGLPTDKIPSPYPNETAARAANNNALPPDLSLITKARANGPAYVYSLLTGYTDAATYKNKEGKALPAEAMPPPGLNFNPYFANLNIAMAQPLAIDDQVTYDDGTKATKDQMAKDVAAFLTWTAEPKMNERKTAGWAALIFLLVFTGLAWMSYKQVWADKKH